MCRLLRPRYGLKQAPCAWHEMLAGVLKRFTFVKVDSDASPCVRDAEHGPLYLLVYVDDFKTAGPREGDLDALELQLVGELGGAHAG